MNDYYLIYGRSNCSYCDAAKDLLLRNGESFTIKNIEYDKEALKEFKLSFPTSKTVPQVLHITAFHQARVGNYTQLVDYLAQQKVEH